MDWIILLTFFADNEKEDYECKEPCSRSPATHKWMSQQAVRTLSWSANESTALALPIFYATLDLAILSGSVVIETSDF